MKVTRVHLKNYRRFEDLDFEFPDENIIILTGENGSGKTSVLDALAKCFSHYVGKLTSNRDESHSISDSLKTSDIRNGTVLSECHIQFNDNFSIEISKQLDDKGTRYDFDENYFDEMRDKILNDKIDKLPLFVYYRVNRTLFSTGSADRSATSKQYDSGQRTVFESEGEYSTGSVYYKPILNGYVNCLHPYISPFINFDKWYIQLENVENEKIKELQNFEYQNPQLQALREIATLYLSYFYKTPNFKIRVSRQGTMQQDPLSIHQGNIFIDYEGNERSVMLSQLSSGEKMIFYIVMDIARRLLILNKGNVAFDKYTGVVLIDEIDLHLHPRWQRQILPALHEVFPGLQFICTTHSPQVLSLAKKSNVYEVDEQIIQSASDPYGGGSNRILEEVFDTTERPEAVQKLVDEIFKELEAESVHFDLADQKLNDLRRLVSSEDPILLRIENFRNRRKLLTR